MARCGSVPESAGPAASIDGAHTHDVLAARSTRSGGTNVDGLHDGDAAAISACWLVVVAIDRCEACVVMAPPAALHVHGRSPRPAWRKQGREHPRLTEEAPPPLSLQAHELSVPCTDSGEVERRPGGRAPAEETTRGPGGSRQECLFSRNGRHAEQHHICMFVDNDR